MKYFLKTFGCQMNVADSERIDRVFVNKGYKKAKNIKEANLVIINTCVVRQSAENRVYGLINNLKKIKPSPVVILTGCLAGWALKDKTGRNLKSLRKKIGPNVQIALTEELADFKIEPLRTDKDHAWVPISNGCNQFCSYCIVPYARGREINRPFEEIVKEVESLVKKGFIKITLLGQTVNSYPSFPWLLQTVAQIQRLKFIDFISPNPWDFSDKLIKVIAKHPNITRTIHLPVQSGDDEILAKMNRPYTSKQYLNLIRKIKKAIPKAKFTTDIIVGFPSETKKQFENTILLCKKIGFARAFISRYSPRPGTPAAKLADNISPEEKKRRWRKLEKLINQAS